MICGLVDLAVGLVMGMGLFGSLDVDQLFSGWLNWAVGVDLYVCLSCVVHSGFVFAGVGFNGHGYSRIFFHSTVPSYLSLRLRVRLAST